MPAANLSVSSADCWSSPAVMKSFEGCCDAGAAGGLEVAIGASAIKDGIAMVFGLALRMTIGGNNA